MRSSIGGWLDINAIMPLGLPLMPMAAMLCGSWLLGHVLGLGLVGVWLSYAADEWIRGLLMWRRWLRLGWLPHARAARRRLR